MPCGKIEKSILHEFPDACTQPCTSNNCHCMVLALEIYKVVYTGLGSQIGRASAWVEGLLPTTDIYTEPKSGMPYPY